MYRLLIVDDEPDIVEGLLAYFKSLEKPELDLYTAYSGFDALEILNSTKIDILLTDILMPGMTGMQLLEKMHDSWPDCRVIFLTGHDKFEYVYKAIRYDSVSYLLKTEGFEEIGAAVVKAAAQIENDHKMTEWMKKAEEPMNPTLPPDSDTLVSAIPDPVSSVDTVKAYINHHISEDISLIKLADLVHFNPSYLSRLFKQATGTNLLTYINKIRIEKAKAFLKESNMKIHEISSSVGYESASYFTQFFRRYVKMSPQEYRDKFK